MICAQQLIFLQFFNTRASSRTISFSISNSFWYYPLLNRTDRKQHRDLAPVQIDLAAACTDSGKLSRKCEYPLKNGAVVRSLGDTETKMAPSLCWDFKLSNEGSFVEIGQEMTKLG